MIFDSVVWKEELEKKIEDFKDYNINEFEVEDERLDMRTEEFFFITSFIVRKLIEALKLSDEYLASQYGVIKHQRNEDDCKIDFLNNHKIDQYYNLESRNHITLNLNRVCNLFIHSYIFIISIDKDCVDGVFVTTDYDKEKFILFISLDEYIRLLEGCCSDNIVSINHNRRTGRLVKSSGYCEDKE